MWKEGYRAIRRLVIRRAIKAVTGVGRRDAPAAAGEEEPGDGEGSWEVAYNAAHPSMWFNFILNHPNPLLNIRFPWLALCVEFLGQLKRTNKQTKLSEWHQVLVFKKNRLFSLLLGNCDWVPLGSGWILQGTFMSFIDPLLVWGIIIAIPLHGGFDFILETQISEDLLRVTKSLVNLDLNPGHWLINCLFWSWR